jgi:glucokinase
LINQLNKGDEEMEEQIVLRAQTKSRYSFEVVLCGNGLYDIRDYTNNHYTGSSNCIRPENIANKIKDKIANEKKYNGNNFQIIQNTTVINLN